MLFLSFFLMVHICLAHPFDAQLVGHRMELSLQRDKIHLDYRLELPLTLLKEDMEQFVSNNPNIIDRDELTESFLERKSQELISEVSLRINDQQVEWKPALKGQKSLQREGKFAIFDMELSAPLTEDIHTVSIINQIHMESQSIFHHTLRVNSDVELYDTDLLPVNDQGVRERFHGQWVASEKLREIRLSYSSRSHTSAVIYEFWRKLNRFPSQIDAPAALIPLSFKSQWISGDVNPYFAIFLMILMLMTTIFFGTHPKSRVFFLIGLGLVSLIFNLSHEWMIGLTELVLTSVLVLLFFWKKAYPTLGMWGVALIGLSTGSSVMGFVSTVLCGAVYCIMGKKEYFSSQTIRRWVAFVLLVEVLLAGWLFFTE